MGGLGSAGRLAARGLDLRRCWRRRYAQDRCRGRYWQGRSKRYIAYLRLRLAIGTGRFL